MLNLGIDFGGTTIKCGIVDENGSVLIKKAVDTPLLDPEKAVSVTATLVMDTLKSYGIGLDGISSVGVGLPGTINSEGVVTYANNLGWYGVPFKAMLENALNKKVYATNDARCALLGEIRYGFGKGAKSVLMVTLGTGIGTALLVNGEIYEGNGSAGGEGGIITYKGGVWEEYASTGALVGRVKKCVKEHTDSPLARYFENGEINGRTIFEAEKDGIEGAKEVIDEHILYVAEGLLSFANFLRPELILIGGGISSEDERVIKPLDKLVNERIYGAPYTPAVNIRQSKLKGDAGIIGAAVITEFKKCDA